MGMRADDRSIIARSIRAPGLQRGHGGVEVRCPRSAAGLGVCLAEFFEDAGLDPPVSRP